MEDGILTRMLQRIIRHILFDFVQKYASALTLEDRKYVYGVETSLHNLINDLGEEKARKADFRKQNPQSKGERGVPHDGASVDNSTKRL